MHGLQVGVGAVLRVALAVVVERGGLGRRSTARTGFSCGRVFVDVVAEVEHDVEIFLGEVPVRREVALLPVLAGREAEAHAIDVGVAAGRGPGPSDRALPRAGAEAVPVGPRRAEAVDFDVDGVGAQRRRVDAAAGDQLREPLVLGDLPRRRGRFLAGHAAAVGERLRARAASRARRRRRAGRPRRRRA